MYVGECVLLVGGGNETEITQSVQSGSGGSVGGGSGGQSLSPHHLGVDGVDGALPVVGEGVGELRHVTFVLSRRQRLHRTTLQRRLRLLHEHHQA